MCVCVGARIFREGNFNEDYVYVFVSVHVCICMYFVRNKKAAVKSPDTGVMLKVALKN